MLQICISWLYIASWFLAAGVSAEWLLKRVFGTNHRDLALPALMRIPLGVAALLPVCSLLHFFVQMSATLHVLLGAALLAAAVAAGRPWALPDFATELRVNRLFWLLTSGVWIILAYVATDYPFYNRDNGRYHFQAVLWAKELPIVPGLANLHDRLGNNSAWYLLNALFDHFWMDRRIFHVLDSGLIVFLFTAALDAMLRRPRSTETARLWHATGLALFAILATNFSYIRTWFFLGVTPDTAVHFLVVCSLLLLIQLKEQRWLESAPEYSGALLTVIALGAWQVRLSGLFLTLSLAALVAVLAWQRKLSSLALVRLGVLATLLTTPIFGRNLILSGYPLFPSLTLDVFSFDWKLPRPIASQTGEHIQNHRLREFENGGARYAGATDGSRLRAVTQLYLGDIGRSGLVSFGFAVNGLVAIWCWVRPRRGRPVDTLLAGACAVFFVQFLGYYAVGPVIRFGFGYLILTVMLPTVLILEGPLGWLRRRGGYTLGVAAMAGATTMIFILRPSTPISIREARLAYPIRVAEDIARHATTFPELVRGIQHTLVVDGLTVNISQFDWTHAGRARLPVPREWFQAECGKPDVVEDNSGCRGYNAFVATMNWMDPLPSAGAIYRGLRLRGLTLRQGFRLAR